MSRTLAVLAACAVLLPVLAAASEGPLVAAATLYEENMQLLLERHPGASESGLAQPVRMLSDRGIRLGSPPELEVAGLAQGVHVGEVLSICESVYWFTNDPYCSATGAFYTGADCTQVSTLAGNAWTPQTLQWTVDGGLYSRTWFRTEELAGFPGVVDSGGSFTGSGCVFEYRAYRHELIIGYGVGVWQES